MGGRGGGRVEGEVGGEAGVGRGGRSREDR